MNLVQKYRDNAVRFLEWFDDPVCNVLPDEERIICALHGYQGGYEAIADSAGRYPANCVWAAQRLRQFAEAAQRRK